MFITLRATVGSGRIGLDDACAQPCVRNRFTLVVDCGTDYLPFVLDRSIILSN